MLSEFVSAHRVRIVEMAAQIIRQRGAPAPTDEELAGLPVFIDQLSAQLLRRSGLSARAGAEIGPTAASRGELLYRLGLGVTQLVHGYGAAGEAIMTVLLAEGATVPTEEYKLLTVCLDEAIAEALSRHSVVGAEARERARDREEAEHLGVLVHELRNALSAVTIAFESMKYTGVPAKGSKTGEIIDRYLRRLETLIDRSLAGARLRAAPELVPERFTLGDLAAEIEGPAVAEAQERGLLMVLRVDEPNVELRADRELIFSALSNLVQNALKFTHAGGTVTVRERAEGDRVRLEVEDECGGLPEGATERLFQPFVQASRDRRGVGLGLAIVQRAAAAHGGSLHVRNKPGAGCVFTIELPRA